MGGVRPGRIEVILEPHDFLSDMHTFRSSVIAFGLVLAAGCGRNPAPAPADAGPASNDPAPPANPGGNPQTPSPAPKPRHFGRVVAVCVGIERYQSPGIPAAEAAERDAAGLARVFRERYGYETVELIGPQATRQKILGELDRLKRELGERDALLVFFAGHGRVVELPSFGRAGYLVPYDADVADADDAAAWAAKAIDMRALSASVDGAAAAHVVFLIDACFSGFMARRGVSPAQSEVAARRSRSVVAATTERQTATRDAATGHGHFTGALLGRLGGAEAKSLTDLYAQVREDVVKSSNRTMLPQRGDFGEDDGEFVFIPLAVPEAQVHEVMQNVRERAALRAARRTTPDELYAAYTAVDYRNGPRQVELETAWRAKLGRFRANAGVGDPLALAAVSLCLAKGLGTEPDPGEALRLARLAYDTGRPEAVVALYHCLVKGVGQAPNKRAADRLVAVGLEPSAHPTLRWLALSARSSDSSDVGELLRCRSGLTEVAEVGVAAAAAPAALLWVELPGKAPPAVEERLTTLLGKLAAADDPEALYVLYVRTAARPSRREPEQVRAAARHLERAAELGHVKAQFRAAVEYYRDTKWFERHLGLEVDLDRAAQWAEYGARQKNQTATKLLAMMLCFGHGVDQDTKRARDLAWGVLKADPKQEKWWVWLYRNCEEQDGKR